MIPLCSGKAAGSPFWEDAAGREWEGRLREKGSGGCMLPNPVGRFFLPAYEEE